MDLCYNSIEDSSAHILDFVTPLYLVYFFMTDTYVRDYENSIYVAVCDAYLPILIIEKGYFRRKLLVNFLFIKIHSKRDSR